MPCEKKTSCDFKDLFQKDQPCCEFVNEELATFVESSTKIYKDTLESLPDEDCRKDVLERVFDDIFSKTVTSFETILCGKCCESAAAALRRVSQAFLELIIAAILDRSLGCNATDTPSALETFICAQLKRLYNAIDLILSTTGSPCEEPCQPCKTEESREYTFHRRDCDVSDEDPCCRKFKYFYFEDSDEEPCHKFKKYDSDDEDLCYHKVKKCDHCKAKKCDSDDSEDLCCHKVKKCDRCKPKHCRKLKHHLGDEKGDDTNEEEEYYQKDDSDNEEEQCHNSDEEESEPEEVISDLHDKREISRKFERNTTTTTFSDGSISKIYRFY